MTPGTMPRIALGLVGLAGTSIFAFFLILTFHTPTWVEEFAAGYIEQEVEERLDAQIDGLQPPSGQNALARMAETLYEDNEATIERYRESLRREVHGRMADAIAEIRDLDCECRDQWAEWLREGTTNRIDMLQRANARITDFIHSTYATVVSDVKRDIRIFSGANALMFLFVVAIALMKPRASLQLFVPAVLLVIATLVCTYFYVFEQDWLLTIIHGDYLGYTYLAYLVAVFGFLCDIVLNRARVTTDLVNSLLHSIGSTLQAFPC